MVLVIEGGERRLAEAFGAPMGQEQEPVVALEARWVVNELEGPDRPRLDARALQQILTNQRAVVAGPGADEKDA
jgi:hypothetical protein